MTNQTPVSNSGSHKTMAIIGLVLGILAFIFSFIPCLGQYALFPAIIGIILSVLALMGANKVAAPKGMAIAALVLSVLATGIAAYQYTLWQKAKSELKKQGLDTDNWKKTIDSIADKAKKNIDTTSKY